MAGPNPFAAPARTAPAAAKSAEELMDGGTSVALKFPRVDYVFKGDIIGFSQAAFQMTDKDTGDLLFWEGKKKTPESKLLQEASKQNPCLQITIDFQGPVTGETWKSNQYIREEVPDDDGIRTAWIAASSELMKALAKARKEAAVKYKLGRPAAPLEVGAHVEIKRTAGKKFANDYYGHTFVARWTPAANNPNYTDKLMDDSDPWETDTSAPAESPAAAPASVPAAPAESPWEDVDEPPF